MSDLDLAKKIALWLDDSDLISTLFYLAVSSPDTFLPDVAGFPTKKKGEKFAKLVFFFFFNRSLIIAF